MSKIFGLILYDVAVQGEVHLAFATEAERSARITAHLRDQFEQHAKDHANDAALKFFEAAEFDHDQAEAHILGDGDEEDADGVLFRTLDADLPTDPVRDAAPAMLAALEEAHRLLKEAVHIHVYGDDETPDEGCSYVAGISQVAAALAAARGEG